MLRKNRFPNIEPELTTYGHFGRWLVNASQIQITNDMVENNFFRQIFRHLEVNNMCFSSGAFVFSNVANVLFNLLTFNKLLIPSNSYYCDNPLGYGDSDYKVIPVEKINIIGTDTHRNFYDKSTDVKLIKPRECMPIKSGYKRIRQDRTNTRFVRVLINSMKNICGFCEETDQDLSEPKGVIMYYPFYIETLINPEIEKEMLYVKFEHHPAGGDISSKMSHVGDYMSRSFGSKQEYPNPRREDDRRPKCVYDEMYANKDYEFYRAYCPQGIDDLIWYNNNIRTGCEFFVSKDLLIYFLKFLFVPYNCDVKSIEEIDEEKYKKNEPIETLTESVKDMSISGNTSESNTNTGGKKKYNSKKYRKLNKTKKNKKRKKTKRRH